MSSVDGEAYLAPPVTMATLLERSFRLSVGLNLTIADWGGVKLDVLKYGGFDTDSEKCRTSGFNV